MKKLWIVAAVTLMSAASPTGAAERSKAAEAQALNARVTAMLQAHDAVGALTVLDPLVGALEQRIEAARAEKREKRVYCASSLPETMAYMLEAAADKVSAIALDENCDLLFLKAYALNELGRRPEGIVVLEKLTELSPRRGNYWSELAFGYGQTGQNDKSILTYRKAMDAVDSLGDDSTKRKIHAVALRGIGWNLVEKGDLDGGEKSYRESLTLEPDNHIALSELQYIASKRPH